MKRLSSKYLIIFLSIFFLSLKKILVYVCVTKHYLFGLVTTLEFLPFVQNVTGFASDTRKK